MNRAVAFDCGSLGYYKDWNTKYHIASFFMVLVLVSFATFLPIPCRVLKVFRIFRISYDFIKYFSAGAIITIGVVVNISSSTSKLNHQCNSSLQKNIDVWGTIMFVCGIFLAQLIQNLLVIAVKDSEIEMLTNKKGGGPRKYSDLEMRKIKNQDSTQPSFDKQVNEYRAIHNRNVEKLAVPNGNNTNQPNHYDIGFKPTLVYHPDNICLNPMEDQNQGRNIPMTNGNAYDAYNMHGFLTPENHDPKANFKNNGANQNTNFQVNVQQYGTANDNFKGNQQGIAKPNNAFHSPPRKSFLFSKDYIPAVIPINEKNKGRQSTMAYERLKIDREKINFASRKYSLYIMEFAVLTQLLLNGVYVGATMQEKYFVFVGEIILYSSFMGIAVLTQVMDVLNHGALKVLFHHTFLCSTITVGLILGCSLHNLYYPYQTSVLTFLGVVEGLVGGILAYVGVIDLFEREVHSKKIESYLPLRHSFVYFSIYMGAITVMLINIYMH